MTSKSDIYYFKYKYFKKKYLEHQNQIGGNNKSNEYNIYVVKKDINDKNRYYLFHMAIFDQNNLQMKYVSSLPHIDNNNLKLFQQFKSFVLLNQTKSKFIQTPLQKFNDEFVNSMIYEHQKLSNNNKILNIFNVIQKSNSGTKFQIYVICDQNGTFNNGILSNDILSNLLNNFKLSLINDHQSLSIPNPFKFMDDIQWKKHFLEIIGNDDNYLLE